MRKTDRERNGMAFPKLYYPELYLLEGGYKAFYAKYPVSHGLISTLLSNVYDTHVVHYLHCSHSCMINHPLPPLGTM